MRYYLIAGEASGDLHASRLMAALKEIDRNVDFRFFGGDLMAAQGGTLVNHYKDTAFMGFIPVLMNLRTIFKNMSRCKEDIKKYMPDVVILIDYPGFNLKMAKYVKTVLHLPVHYYISPKIWAWKEYRIKSIKKYVDNMLCILPFETDFYKKRDYVVDYVGNPTVDEIAEREYKNETFGHYIAENRLADKPIIALLPGSRKHEISKNLPVMLESAGSFAGYRPVIAGAPGIAPEFYQTVKDIRDTPVVFGQTYRLIQQADAALVTSGTATLETALLKVPQVVCYYTGGGKLTYLLLRAILHVEFISLVNLIAGREVVKELPAHLLTTENLRRELSNIIENEPFRKKMLDGYEEVIRKLGPPGAARKAAQVIFNSIRNRV
ncbi:MAG: lipid-A-disaccharide synthase [Candidatus Azobacteroides sp.]|nr:lipid-A-disaccharide synthase [Candidatus Azobacteroides sp.]